MSRNKEAKDGPDGGTPAPLLQVTKGEPNAEELAALTAVVLAIGADETNGDAGSSQGQARSRSWIRRAALRLDPRPGPGSWRRSRG
ncbi:acyl-CoA carboxylase subunit epsilon [Pseudarthrobacter sp. J1738]|uniref:acyl-CoA carboxylase subunit epsilon n=1 Tax=unclassified Pseudarthrobacter TaxID=2647000 RepID=UPI003D2A60DE